MYNKKEITTNLKKNTLRKLLKDTCTKTVFSSNNQLYKQNDGVSMGSPLGPILANILMTELELNTVPKLQQSGTIKFYTRFVDDTLLLARPSEFENILNTFNSFHKQIKFTYESFDNCSTMHFLDLQVDTATLEIGIYRKTTHTGQYTNYDSYAPWHHKTAWIRSSLSRAHKLCTGQYLKTEINCIKQFMSWNGFPLKASNMLLNKFKNKQNRIPNEDDDKLDKIWIRLPYLGKAGEEMLSRCLKKVRRNLNKPVKFITLWQYKKISYFISTKDKTPKEYVSSIVYHFKCPGCNSGYIGKTERCLITRLNEHATSSNSVIHEHINTCEGFKHIVDLQNIDLNDDNIDTRNSCINLGLIYNCTQMIDSSTNWNLLLFKEAFAIKKHNPILNNGLKASKELSLFI